MEKLTTLAACNAAGISRQRFNEFVARGDYTCAPETIAGRSRFFDENDVVALFVFARLMERKLRPASAGQVASQVSESLRKNPGLNALALGDDLITNYFNLARIREHLVHQYQPTLSQRGAKTADFCGGR